MYLFYQNLWKLILGVILMGMNACSLESAALPTFGNESDYLALLDLKRRITEDPLRIMSSWNNSINFCSWAGVTCNDSNKRIIILNVDAQNLVGSLPPSIGNLTYLTGINLRNNSFHGELPREMGRLINLQYLNISYNFFGGKIPANMSHCTQLRVLNIFFNQFIGPIPVELGSLVDLTVLWLGKNNLTGRIPDWIGNFSSMYGLSLGENNLQGSIPNELGHLKGLGLLILGVNNLSGMVPSSIYNFFFIYSFSVAVNQLHGELPPNVSITLPNLETFIGALNRFTGTIPASLSNASRLQLLDFGDNGFTGKLPQNFGSLHSLVKLNFDVNRLGSGKAGDLNFFSFLANCTSLVSLGLSRNCFGGELPASIANLSTQLKVLTLGKNLIHGSIPKGIRNLVNLTSLGLEANYFSGYVPEEIGKLWNLGALHLNHNNFSGPIPSSLGNLTSLTRFHMQNNRFEGSIPPNLGNCRNLLILNLSSNNLTGAISREVMAIKSLSISLTMSNNSFTGSLPSEVGGLVNLAELDVSGNQLSGEIPKSLGNCISLERLLLEGNEFSGGIPQSMEKLRGVEVLDISCNNLSGQLPEFVGRFRSLKLLNLSHNDFEGELPKEGSFLNASIVSVLGNNRLCGGIPELLLPACSSNKPHSSQGALAPKVMIPLFCVIAFIIALSCFIAAHSMRKMSGGRLLTSPSYKDSHSSISYLELVESTNGFSEQNLIGPGSFGSVYKGLLGGEGMAVAVKVLNLQQHGASKSFIDECKALRSTRHRNLLKIITACSSIDNQGNDFKSLVFELMENGSLDSWLHPRDDDISQRKRLSLIQRLNIAIDVASAMEYLHLHCQASIVHCDIKPSNVLLDEDMVAHVGDFGLARFLLEGSNNSSKTQTMSAGLKGSVGYIPPEYGMGGQISILGDIYSYGILLLEMFTGKRPTDDMFKDDLSIHQFAAMALPHHVMDIADPSLLLETDDEDDDTRFANDIQERPITRYQDCPQVNTRRLEECMVSVIQIGLLCSALSPRERMLMDITANKMKAIRDSYESYLN